MKDHRPVLLDLFCGAGGCTHGYTLAGFKVIGVDKIHQKNYCGWKFVQSDVFDYLKATNLENVVAVHASPPCQAHSSLKHLHKGKTHPDLIGATRNALLASRLPFIIENVPGAILRCPVTLCGSMFDLNVRRHRLFETAGFEIEELKCDHDKQEGKLIGVYGHGQTQGNRARGWSSGEPLRQAAMQIDWMNRDELSQAIPPAYTRHIGLCLMRALG